MDATREVTYHEVIWDADDDQGRMNYPDDMDYLGIVPAEIRAANKLLEFIKAAVPAGLYVNGVFKAGRNITAAYWAVEDGKALYAGQRSQPSGRWTGVGTHRTRTIEWTTGERYKTKSNGSCGRFVPTMMAKAECLCGWNEHAGDRSDARSRARVHRATAR